jgi:hypothetical protein
MSLENALWLAGIVTEAAVLGLLLYQRAWRTLPLFCAYCTWDILSNAANYPIRHYFFDSYRTVYLTETVVDSVLVFGVLVELAWSVLRPIRRSLPRGSLIAVGILLVAVGAATWPFTGIHGLSSLAPQIRGIVRMQQTTSLLRILFFLALAALSQLLSIGWRDRELQVATGLGFYSFVSVAVEIAHSYQTMGAQYRLLNQFVVASYVLSLLYWVFSFAQKEAERREFTPQMQQFLLAVAGNARATRLAMASSAVDKTRGGGKS